MDWCRSRLLVLFVVFLLFGEFAEARSTSVVISQVHSAQFYSSPENRIRLRNDFIELFNVGNVPVNMSGWTLQIGPGSDVTWDAIPLSGTINPGQYFLVKSGDSGGTIAVPEPNMASGKGNVRLDPLGARIALVSDSAVLDVDCPASTRTVDFVSYGNSVCVNSAPALQDATSLIRADGGCTDTDDSSVDFVLVTPLPRTLQSPLNLCGLDPSVSRTSFSFVTGGGVSLQTSGSASTVGTGYTRILPTAPNATPSGLAIFSFRQGSTLVSEATVPSAPLLSSATCMPKSMAV